MRLLDSITITESSRLDNLPLTIPLEDLTVLMGPNGCGKSTILQAIADIPHGRWDRKSYTTAIPGLADGVHRFEIYSLSYKDLANIRQSSDDYEDMLHMIHDCMDQGHISSGERSASQMDDIRGCRGGLILIDEMDASLDWQGQKEFFGKLKSLSWHNQVIAATHSVIVAELAGNVYDVSRRIWTTSEEMKRHYCI